MKPSIEQQFLQAYEEYADAIYRHCVVRVTDSEKGMELMQETFLRALESVQQGTKVENMRAFLYKIANNLIIDTYRQKRHDSSLDEMAEAYGFDPADERTDVNVARVHQGMEAIEHLHLLEEPYRTVLIMRYVDGLPVKDIADVLGVTVNVASVRIHRGLKQLTSLLGPTHA